MDRRDFLKMIGLGGIALTTPLPLKIVTARMADLEKPPIYAGFTEMGPVPGFDMYGISISQDKTTNWKDALSFSENWLFTLTFRDRQTLKGTTFVKTPAANLLYVPAVFSKKGSTAHRDPFIPLMRPFRFSENDIAEAWLVPCPLSEYEDDERERVPLRPLPESTLFFQGVLYRDGKVFKQALYSKFDNVRLDHARAIELGLVQPGEKEETWQDFRKS